MTSIDRTPEQSQALPQAPTPDRPGTKGGVLRWVEVIIGLLALIAVIIFVLSGHTDAAVAAGAIAATVGGVQVTVHIRR